MEYTDDTEPERGTEFLKESLPKPLRREGMCSPKPIFYSTNSLTPVPSPNGEGRDYCY